MIKVLSRGRDRERKHKNKRRKKKEEGNQAMKEERRGPTGKSLEETRERKSVSE